MEHIIRLKLIEGEFTDEDAREVLLGLLSYKLNFHDLKNFSHMEREGVEHTASVKRMQALKADQLLIISWLRGIESGKTIRIQSDILVVVEGD